MKKILMLDFDDIVVLNRPYGGFDVIAPSPPANLFNLLFDPGCVNVLRQIDQAYDLEYVLTTSWLRFMEPALIKSVLERGGVRFVAEKLHAVPEARPVGRGSRADAIFGWLCRHGVGRQFVVLDDALSGTGLKTSSFLARHVVFCEVDQGLTDGHLAPVAAALALPPFNP